MIFALYALLHTVNILVVIYWVVLNAFYSATTLIAFVSLRRYAHWLRVREDQEFTIARGAPPITLIAPAYNEEHTCIESVRSLLTLRYPEYEVLVVNDGSSDQTIEQLTSAFDLELQPRLATADLQTMPVRASYQSRRHPNLWVLDKENGGKADALNTGLNFCRTPVFCAIDADTLLESDALTRVARPFMEDRSTIAVGGIIRIVNGCSVSHGTVTNVRLPRNLVARLQVIEYLRAFLTGRVGWSALDAMLIISGAFGLFRRSIVVEAGGFATDTVGEDMELVVRLHRYCRDHGIKYRITFVPDPVAWTECPESLRVLGRQRDRWQRGLAQTLTRHRRMLFNPRYGRIGLLAFPYFYFLEMIGPVIEALGYLSFAASLALGIVDPRMALVFFIVAFTFGVLISSVSVVLEELTFRRYKRARDFVQLFALALVESLGYRQLSVYWRLRGLMTARQKHKWGLMVRKGFQTAE